MFDYVDSHEYPIGALGFLEHTINPAVIVCPAEGSFHFPPLPRIPSLARVFRRPTSKDCLMVTASGSNGNDTTLPQLTAMRFAVIALIQAEPLGFTLTPAYSDAVNGA